MVTGMAEKYGKAHFEKVAFSESCHKSAFLDAFRLWCSCTYPNGVARVCLVRDGAIVSTATV